MTGDDLERNAKLEAMTNEERAAYEAAKLRLAGLRVRLASLRERLELAEEKEKP